jgi:hypothetical protein
LQPGGQPLPGGNPKDRDFAFARQLSIYAPILARGNVHDEATALRARDEMLAVDLSQVRVGIPFNRLSEDAFHGTEHRSIASWFAEVPPPRTPEGDASVIRDEDAYLADPSDQNLRALDLAIVRATQPVKTGAEQLALLKVRALLLLQHHLRTGRLARLSKRGQFGPNQNPFWDIGEFGRLMAQDARIEALRLPEPLQADKSGGPTFADQASDLRLPWFWLGWMLDPGLQLSGSIGETQRADYFSQFLWTDGPYASHLAFMVSKRMIEQAYRPSNWNSRFPQQFELQYSSFLVGDFLQRLEPTLAEHRKLFRKFTANVLRMGIFLLSADILRTKTVIRPESQLFQLRLSEQTLAKFDPRPEDATVVRTLRHQIRGAKALR